MTPVHCECGGAQQQAGTGPPDNPSRRPRLLEEFRHVDVEGMGDEEQLAGFGIAAPALDALDGVDGESRQFPQPLLGEVLVYAPGRYASTGPDAGVEDPLRRGGRHSTNLRPAVIIRPQQFCGFIRSW